MCVQGELSVILAVPSTTTRTECGHSPSVRTLSILNSLWFGLYCYWMWFFKTTLHFEFTVRQYQHPTLDTLHQLLHREKIESSWRLSKHTHKPLHISSLTGDLMGSVSLDMFDIGATNSPGSLVYWNQRLQSLLLKPHCQRKDIKATMVTDCMFSQLDLWEEGSSPFIWLSVLYTMGELPSWVFPCLKWCLGHEWFSVTKREHFDQW